MYQYDDIGVRIRNDNAGDEWATAHRSLGPTFNMHDIDALVGFMAFGQNTGEKLFLEYVPDAWNNRSKLIRNFAAVAMFDRKATEATAFSEHNRLSVAYYLWLCRCVGGSQPLPPKFFFVVGGKSPPWTMIELDISTGERTGVRQEITSTRDWRPLWDAVGLSKIRNQLRAFVER